MAENSVESYRGDIQDFLQYNTKAIAEYAPEDITEYLATLSGLGLANTSWPVKGGSQAVLWLFTG